MTALDATADDGTSPALVPDDERVLTRAGLNRKAELLFHAERLFRARGYASTRMVDIAAEAGVTKGNLYWYFDTKDALAREIAIDARDRLRAAQRDATRGLDDPLDIVHRGTVAVMQFSLHESPLWTSVHDVGGDAMRETLAESSLIHAADAAVAFRAGQKIGTVREDEDPIALGLVAEGIVNQMVQAVLRGHLDEDVAVAMAARSVVVFAAASPEIARAVLGRAEFQR